MKNINKKVLEQWSQEGLQKIRDYFKNPDDIQSLTDFMANFNHYSMKNQALIQRQYKGALAVGSFKFFNQHGLRINKGEEAIRIYAPTEYKVARLENGKSVTPKYWTDDIKQGIKEGKYQVEKHQTFVPVPVFDILQTNAKPEDLPTLFPNRPFNFDFSQVQNKEQLLNILKQLANKHQIDIKYATGKEMESVAKGQSVTYLQTNQQAIILNQRLSTEEQIPTLIHELTHAFLHQKYQNQDYETYEKEFQAEFCSYLTCKTFGIDTSEEAIPYIAEWTKNLEALDDQALIQQLNLIKETSLYISDEVMKTSEGQLVYKTPEQLKEMLNHEQKEQTLSDKQTKETMPSLENTLEHIQVKTTFKGHDFLYDIHIHPEHQSVSGTYQRDQASKHPATTSACLSALRYVIKNHDLNQAEVQYLNQVITQGEAQLNQESAQETKQSSVKTSEKNTYHTWKEQLEYARSANIIEVAQSAGLQLMREGNNQYRDVNNHSMVFTPSKNSYYENNGQFGGDPIHFVQHVVGIQDFKDAVQYLNDQQYGQVDLEAIQRKSPYQYDASKESKDFSKARQYLVQERRIDGKLVDQLHQMGLIRQDNRNNVLFLWDDGGKAVGCTEQGTVRMKEPVNGRDHWKGIQRNSSSNHGFNFGTGEPKHLKFFEAPIDALSYASLYGLAPNTRYIAMDGLKENTVIQYLQKAMEKTGDHIESIQLCVDNDEAGDKFIQKFNQIKQLDSEGQDVFIKIEGNQPHKPQNEDKWDWNNALIWQDEKIEQQKKCLENYESYGFSKPLLENLIESDKIEVTEDTIIFKENHHECVSYQLADQTESILNHESTFSIGEDYPEHLMLFKNELELISYLSIHPQQEDTCYLSTHDFNQETLQNIIDTYQSTVQDITISVANQCDAEKTFHHIAPILPESMTVHSSSEPIATSYFKQCQKTQSLIQQQEGHELV